MSTESNLLPTEGNLEIQEKEWLNSVLLECHPMWLTLYMYRYVCMYKCIYEIEKWSVFYLLDM